MGTQPHLRPSNTTMWQFSFTYVVLLCGNENWQFGARPRMSAATAVYRMNLEVEPPPAKLWREYVRRAA